MDNTNELVLNSIDTMVENNWLEQRVNEMKRTDIEKAVRNWTTVSYLIKRELEEEILAREAVESLAWADLTVGLLSPGRTKYRKHHLS